jgi:hypothetical protein
VALSAHGYAFDEILSPSDARCRTGFFARTFFAHTLRVIVLSKSHADPIREQGKSDGGGD